MQKLLKYLAMSSSEFLHRIQSDKSISQNRELMESYLRNAVSKPGFSRISVVQQPQALPSEGSPLSLTSETNETSSRLHSLVSRKNAELAKAIFEMQHPEISDPKGRYR